MLQRGTDASQLPGTLGHVQRAARQPGLERFTFHVFHDQAQVAVDFDKIVDWNDVGVIQPGHLARLVLEAHSERGVFAQGSLQHLERHIAVEGGLIGFIHIGQAALPQLGHDAVRADRGAIA